MSEATGASLMAWQLERRLVRKGATGRQILVHFTACKVLLDEETL
jgi:hypothetical protein